MRPLLWAAILIAPAVGAAPSHPLQAALQSIDRATPPASDAEQASVPLPRQRELVRRALAQTRQTAQGEVPNALVSERLRLLERLLILIEGRLQLEAQADATEPTAQAWGSRHQQTLPDKPPYPVPLLDALRDERDLLASRLNLLDTELATQEASLLRLNEDKRKAAEGVRLLAERVATGREPRSGPDVRDKELIAQLRLQVHETELLLTHDARDRSQGERTSLKTRLDQLDAQLATLARDPRLDETDLALLQEESQQRLARVTREAADNETRLAELVLLQRDAEDGPLQQARRREQGVRRAIQGAHASFDAIEQATWDAWRKRAALYAEADAAQQQAVADFIRQSLERLTARSAVDAGQLTAARQAANDQAQRLERLSPDAPELDAERALWLAQQQQVQVLERTQQAMQALQKLYERSRQDLAQLDTRQSWGERLFQAWSWLSLRAQGIWQYELFAASDTSVIDGRTVTVQYGVTVGKSVGALLLFVLGYWLAGKLASVGERALIRRFNVNPQLARVLKRWVLFSGALIVLVIVLNLARIPLTVFAFLGGALAIGIGFGTQNIIKNLISGVIILFERKVRVGDIVTIGTVTGTVSAVDLRATSVRGFDGIESILPNSTLLENQVSNWTYPAPLLRRSVKVGIAYESDPAEAARLIGACTQANANVLQEPAPKVLLENFGDHALELNLFYWMRLPGLVSGPELDSQLRFAILDALRQAGIPIAFPQQDVHLDCAEALRVEILPHARQ